jgi:hypothetical protein
VTYFGLTSSNGAGRFNEGVLVEFVVGSIAFGLAAARFISQPEWLRE